MHFKRSKHLWCNTGTQVQELKQSRKVPANPSVLSFKYYVQICQLAYWVWPWTVPCNKTKKHIHQNHFFLFVTLKIKTCVTRMSSVVIPSTTKAGEKPFTDVKERVHSPCGTSCWETKHHWMDPVCQKIQALQSMFTHLQNVRRFQLNIGNLIYLESRIPKTCLNCLVFWQEIEKIILLECILFSLIWIANCS